MPSTNKLMLAGPCGQLEVILTEPENLTHNSTAIICHPHPLQEGTMHNKVVTILAKTFDSLGMRAIRFNYRGVGKSDGEYGNKVGETQDLLALFSWAQQQWPGTEITLAGFSFGSYIAASVANQHAIKQLITIAPAVNHGDFQALDNINCPWITIQGEDDEVVPYEQVKQFIEQSNYPIQFLSMPETGHFFHGKLIDLKESLLRLLS